MGIAQAGISAMLRAVANLSITPEHLLLDFVHLDRCHIPFQTVVKGDSISYSIAAASNVAKVARGTCWMEEADGLYPGYSNSPATRGILPPRHRARLMEVGPLRDSPAFVRAGASGGSAMGRRLTCPRLGPNWEPGVSRWPAGASKARGTEFLLQTTATATARWT